MNYFEEYRKAHDEMKHSIDLDILMAKLKSAQEQVDKIKEPYLDRIKAAADGIKETVLDRQQTMVLHGVEATYTKPRTSVSWKGVAMSFEPPNELIEEHSKVGHPSVKIKVQEIQMETHITTYLEKDEEEDEIPF